MSCETPETFTCTGAGASILTHTSLRFVQTSDPVLGSNQVGVPTGPFNAELYKLLQNDCSLAAFVHNYFARTHGTSGVAAPADTVAPVPLAGAPVSPADKVMHVVYYTNAEVTYQFNGISGLWEEKGRTGKVYTAIAFHRAVLTLPVVDADDNVSFTIPVVDDLGNSVAFTIEDVKIIYVNNLDAASPVVGVVPGLTAEGGGAMRVVLTSQPADGSVYEVIVIFEKVIVS